MRTVITGGAGFLGAQLATRLLGAPGTDSEGPEHRHVIVADRVPVTIAAGADLRLEFREVDLCGPVSALDELVEGADAVVHLASVVSADAEADPERAWTLNVDASRRLLEACGRRARGCRFLAASSVAVFSASDEASSDETKARPRSTYGMTKVVLEYLVQEATRRGAVDGRVARLPTVIVRPGRPNLAASSFASGVFREPLDGQPCVVPVHTDVGLVVIGHRAAVAGLDALLAAPAEQLGDERAVNLPGLCVTVSEMIDACRSVGLRRGRVMGSVSVEPDPAIEAIVSSWPSRWAADRARRLGLPADSSLESVIEQYLDDFADRS